MGGLSLFWGGLSHLGGGPISGCPAGRVREGPIFGWGGRSHLGVSLFWGGSRGGCPYF